MEQSFWNLSNLFFEINSKIRQTDVAIGYMNRYSLALSIRLFDFERAICIVKELTVEAAEVADIDVSYLGILNNECARCN